MSVEDFQSIQFYVKTAFPEQLVSVRIDNTWHDAAEGIVGNWIGLVYQLTHEQRDLPFMDGVDLNNPLALDWIT